ncbi:MAG: hypothetical protein ABI577_03275 [bacterium]
MANYPATPSEPDWLTEIAARVRSLLERRPSDSPADVYVWSDGTVTGPRDTGDRTDDLRLVATFTPGEEPTAAAIEETVRNGLAAVPRGEGLPTVADGA